MSVQTLIQVVISLMSFGLGNYILYTSYLVLSGYGTEMYPEAAGLFAEAIKAIPFDITAGILLVVWPFYHARSLKKI